MSSSGRHNGRVCLCDRCNSDTYQQFWTTNYQGALWATNNRAGFHFKAITNITKANPGVVTINGHGLVTGDQIWVNEVGGMTQINGQTLTVTKIDANTFSIGIDTSAYGAYTSGGIAQYLTNSISGQDGIRWYDGDMTGTTGIPSSTSTGWINFAPPLTTTTVSINDKTAKLYYLVGALAIVAFKDRLVFFSPWIQASDGSAAIQLNDTALWSWNGTPYYSSLTPTGETSDVTAYYVDQAGKGGYLSSGLNQSITTVSNNEDVLIVGFTGRFTRFVYTSNDISPFLFYIVNSEFGSESTFSAVTFDRGVLTLGAYGVFLTTQISSQRVDLPMPNQIFSLNAQNNAVQRISAARDFYHEWIHITFVPDSSQWIYPTQTFQYNYREESWAIFYENFTSHGLFRNQTGKTWASLTVSWASTAESWQSGSFAPYVPAVVAGNPQGFVVQKGQGCGEAPTGSIKAIASSNNLTQITSANHCVNVGDYLYFLNGIKQGGSSYLNGKIGRVTSTPDANTFVVDTPYQSETYLGLGTYTRLIQPFVQTKQFPAYWNEGRKVRVGAQKYLMDTTASGQISVYIYLSQDPDDPWNNSAIVPSDESTNNSLMYSTTLYTCPESTNIGLTQFTQSINNPNPIAGSQYQIWHRLNTSLIGDTFQIGLTLNDTQMRTLEYVFSEMTIHAMQFDISRGPLLT